MCSLDYAGYSTVRPGFPLPPEQLLELLEGAGHTVATGWRTVVERNSR
jgi:hypothetical protein